MKRFSFFFISLFLFSCSQYYGENKNKEIDAKTEILGLRVTDTISLPLPLSVSHIITKLDYNRDRKELLFCVGDTIFLYKKNKLHKKITLTKKVNTFSAFGNNFIAFDYNSKTIYLMDSIGTLKKSYKISPSIKYFPSPIVKIAPIIKTNNNIIFFGNIAGEYLDENKDNRKVIGAYNLKSGIVNYFGSYPDVYKKNWGGGLFRWVYADYNPKNKKVVISFPASHYLDVYNIDNLSHIETYFAGSKYVKSTKYLNKNKILPIESELKIKHFAETPSYSKIIYDPYRDLYYRVVEKATQYEGIIGWTKEISIIILNNVFERVGETFIGKTLSNNRYTIYVDEEGLKIPMISSEEELKFKNYKICTIKE